MPDSSPGRGPRNDDDEEARRDRHMLELLNELRVALPGVQILFAFLLTVPFTQRFGVLNGFQRDVFFLTLIFTGVATVFLIAPSAAHRVRFHQNDRAWIVESANRMMLGGLVFLALAIGGAVLLITDLMFDGARVWLYAGGLFGLAILVWFLRPLRRTLTGEHSGP